MKIRRFLTTAAVAAVVAANGYALSPDHEAWSKGPASILMTKDEQAAWKKIRTDDEAAKFIDLFWARRDPTASTPRNEFREDFDTRVKYADEQFTVGRKKGSMTDRGRVFVLFGSPSKVQRAQSQNANQQSFSESEGGEVTNAARQIWLWEDAKGVEIFGMEDATLNFFDQYGRGDFILDRSARNADLARAQAKAIEKAITQPNLTEAPKFQAQATTAAAAPAPVAAVPAPVAATPQVVASDFTNAAYRTAVEEFRAAKTNPYAAKASYPIWGEYITADGQTFVPVTLYVPKAAGLTLEQNLTFFGAVTDESGKNVLVVEEPARLRASTTDFYTDKSLSLPPGKYKATFGIAEGGVPVTMASTDMTVAGLDKAAAGISQLILSNNIQAMQSAQKPDEPYAFGGVKVVPKADKVFKQADELWYFFELRNPGRNEQGIPKVQTKLELEGKIAGSNKPYRAAQAPREAEVTEIKGVPGHYGVGSAIPLSGFEPGEYTLKVKVIDSVSKQTYNLVETFRLEK